MEAGFKPALRDDFAAVQQREISYTQCGSEKLRLHRRRLTSLNL